MNGSKKKSQGTLGIIFNWIKMKNTVIGCSQSNTWRKSVALNPCIRKKEWSKMIGLSFYLNEVEK